MRLGILYESILKEGRVESCLGRLGEKLPINGVMDCVSESPGILHPEGEVYKTINLSLSDLLNQYEDITDDLTKGGIFDFVYNPSSSENWCNDKSSAESYAKISPILSKYTNQKDINIKEIYSNMGNIPVPVTIRLNSSKDDMLFKAKYFPQSNSDGELIRINTKPTKVTGTIIESLLEPVHNILKAIRRYESKSRK